MSLGIIGIDPTRVTTTQEFALGVRGAVEDQTSGSGVKEYMYVSFAASTAVSSGSAVAVSPAGAAVALTSTNAAAGQSVGRRIGVTVVAVTSVASVQYGWVQIYGSGLVLATAAIAINTNLTSTATAGSLGAAGVAVTGIVLTAVGAGATPVACTINYPFVTG